VGMRIQASVELSYRFYSKVVFVAGAVILAICTVALCPAQAGHQGKGNAVSRGDDAARGKYIVQGVAVCGQCHTPREANGTPDQSRMLEGAPVWLKSAEGSENWPLLAPRLAGNPPGTDEEMVTLLTTGIWRGGYLRPPMPQFRMIREDAEAVVAYLKTLTPGSK
jgi:mono/diheme cytochrome c family protein